jgi:predicted P-loop ATPase
MTKSSLLNLENLELPLNQALRRDNQGGGCGRRRARNVCSREAERSSHEQNARADWRKRLITNRDGTPKPALANVLTAFRFAPEWQGVLAFDEFAYRTVLRRLAPWMTPGGKLLEEWTPSCDVLATEWLHHQGIFASIETTTQAVEVVSREQPYHPVRTYLESLKWDGSARLESWLTKYLGVAPSAYAAAVGSRWMISAVARVFAPGCKADCCLILEGEQGIQKSTALRVLAQPWFTDDIGDLGSKDAALQTRGAWVIELAELDAMARSEIGRIKAFMSRPIDRFRPPYGRRLVESPRQCVFAGTVNDSEYLRDASGGRRFWPVRCEAEMIDIEGLGAVRDQLWAEATCLYFEGKPWWLDSEALNRSAREEQARRYEGGPWDELILAWVESRESVSIAEVLERCIQKPSERWTQADYNSVARCLRAHGWRRVRDREGGQREWRYRYFG